MSSRRRTSRSTIWFQIACGRWATDSTVWASWIGYLVMHGCCMPDSSLKRARDLAMRTTRAVMPPRSPTLGASAVPRAGRSCNPSTPGLKVRDGASSSTSGTSWLVVSIGHRPQDRQRSLYEDCHRRAAVLEYRPDAGTTQALFISLLTFRAVDPEVALLRLPAV